jgi:hypothetical protein
MNPLKTITFVPHPMKRFYPDAPDRFHILSIAQTEEYREWKWGNSRTCKHNGYGFRVPKRFRKI